MPEFANPWVLLALPLPWVITRFAGSRRADNAGAVRVPFFSFIPSTSAPDTRASRSLAMTNWRYALAMAMWSALLIALAWPQVPGRTLESTYAQREVMLAVDVSGSMLRSDLPAGNDEARERLDVVKSVLEKFIRARSGDRLGLIVFGSKAYIQSPFTEDTDAVLALLQGTQAGMAGAQTALGDAIGLAIRAFEASELEQRLLIVLTDGSDTSSRMTPLNAAHIAAQRGIEMITVGFGNPDTEGEDRVDFQMLQAMAKVTDGQFYAAADAQTLGRVYETINALTPRERTSVRHQLNESLAHWPLAFSLLAGLIVLILPEAQGA